MPYKPYSLPHLPRKRCPFEVLTSKEQLSYDKRTSYALITSRLCNQPALAHGWCHEHGYVQEVLDVAASLDYPELAVNEFLSVGRGIANWEGMAERMTMERKKQVMKSLAERHQKMAQFRGRIRSNGAPGKFESEIA